MPDTTLAEKKTVLQILSSFKGTGPLRELLAQLNYDPLNEPVSRKDWPEPAQAALAQDPRLYGRAAGEFYVIYAQLAADKLRLTDERLVIPQLLKQYPYALFVFSDKSQTSFHFVNVKWENAQKRRLYRRITVGEHERMRTAAERISMLDMETIDGGLFGLSAQAVQDRHDEAFDVSKVSKSFFEEYKRVFEVVKEAVKGFGRSEAEQDRRHLFTQRLFNRIMFLRFIQKKGWLTIDGSTDYLAALWASHLKLKQDGKNFYEDRLRLLFAALNNERAGIVLRGGGGAVEATIGKVKYLNGGLFEETEEDKDPKVHIPDAPFKQIFDKADGLFEKFNFTITESTPLDVEIAVDPEMLGKIFEELVTGRHDSGSYYTPKPIVSFMCREALKGYLETQVSGEQKAALERFVDKHEPDDIRNAEAVLNALRCVTVCDPACGSGAYLLGMMHELLDLRQCLFQTRQVDNKTMYQRKLDIIQTNIYGVDLAEFAVNIARLRLWLSLAVDYEGPEPQPLPNLDYKIETGDSVCSPSPGALQMGIQQPLVDEFLKLKKQYLVAHHAEKPMLRSQVESLRQQIMGFSNRDAYGFDWVVDFAEVFVDGGFDIVLANPPYVKQELIVNLKPQLQKRFPATYSGRADLYTYFYARGFELLKHDSGVLSFISSSSWLRAGYGSGLRSWISTHACLSLIVDFGELPVFQEAATFPMIFIGLKKTGSNTLKHLKVDSLSDPYPDIKLMVERSARTVEQACLTDLPWTFATDAASSVISRMQSRSTTLIDYLAGIPIYSGIKTGYNNAFYLDDATYRNLVRADRASKQLIKLLATGDDIRAWHIRNQSRYLIYTHSGIDIEDYPAVQKHLKSFKRRLEERAGPQKWWQLQQAQYAGGIWDRPKIMYPDICMESRFTFDTRRYHLDMNGFIIPTEDLYLLGVLNSTSTWFYLRNATAVIGDAAADGRLRLKRQYMMSVPVPIVAPSIRSEVEALVAHCLEKTGMDCSEEEAAISEIVASALGLGERELRLA